MWAHCLIWISRNEISLVRISARFSSRDPKNPTSRAYGRGWKSCLGRDSSQGIKTSRRKDPLSHNSLARVFFSYNFLLLNRVTDIHIYIHFFQHASFVIGWLVKFIQRPTIRKPVGSKARQWRWSWLRGQDRVTHMQYVRTRRCSYPLSFAMIHCNTWKIKWIKKKTIK